MVHASPLSLSNLPATLAMGIAFAPPLAALWARRSVVRDPAGRIAVGWLLMALAGSVGFVRYFVFGLPPMTSLSFFVTPLSPVLLAPPTLTWVGGNAKRWQWPALAAWLALCLVAGVVLRDTRAFKTVLDPLMSLSMFTLSGVALAMQVRRNPVSIGRTNWFWILTGQMMYFVTDTFRQPIMESLVARHLTDAMMPVNGALMLLYSLTYLVIARGMLLRSSAASTQHIAGSVGQAA